jgi:hypothetical protein
LSQEEPMSAPHRRRAGPRRRTIDLDDPRCRSCQRVVVQDFHRMVRHAPAGTLRSAERVCRDCASYGQHMARRYGPAGRRVDPDAFREVPQEHRHRLLRAAAAMERAAARAVPRQLLVPLAALIGVALVALAAAG